LAKPDINPRNQRSPQNFDAHPLLGSVVAENPIRTRLRFTTFTPLDNPET
jgi:hypothetical protein